MMFVQRRIYLEFQLKMWYKMKKPLRSRGFGTFKRIANPQYAETY